jgi:hypothetical protein
MHTYPTPLHPVVTIGPFSKRGIDFMKCNPTSTNGHGYIIIVVDYFTIWVEYFRTFSNDDTTTTHFVLNHIIDRFDVPNTIVMDHGSHFRNKMMIKLASRLGFHHENLISYYPQTSGEVESINRVLKTTIQRMLGKHKKKWHLMLFLALWAYHTYSKTTTGFTPFQLVYDLEVVLPIECEISSLKLIVELFPKTSTDEEHLLYLYLLDEHHHDATMVNETHKKHVKSQYEKYFYLSVFSEGDLVLVYDQDHDMLGVGKFEPL